MIISILLFVTQKLLKMEVALVSFIAEISRGSKRYPSLTLGDFQNGITIGKNKDTGDLLVKMGPPPKPQPKPLHHIYFECVEALLREGDWSLGTEYKKERHNSSSQFFEEVRHNQKQKPLPKQRHEKGARIYGYKKRT